VSFNFSSIQKFFTEHHDVYGGEVERLEVQLRRDLVNSADEAVRVDQVLHDRVDETKWDNERGNSCKRRGDGEVDLPILSISFGRKVFGGNIKI
jgi:hypothetical protein